MATATVLTSRKYVYVDLNVNEKSGSGNSATNKSTIEWNVVIRKGSVSWNTSWVSWGQRIYATIDIDGMGSKTIYIPTYNYNGTLPPGSVVSSGSFEIAHGSDGNKTVNFGISFTDNADGYTTKEDGTKSYYTPGDASRVAGSLTCARINRYATSNQSLASKTETSITMNWSSDNTVDYIWYSKDNGANWTGVDVSDGTSGSYTIGGLSANTTYNIKTRVRRKDSQLTTDSSNLPVATYNYPHINSTPNFTIGNTLTLGIYNPLGRVVKAYLINASGTSESGGNETSGTSISGYTNSTYKNLLYSGIPNSKSGTYKVRLICSALGRDTTITGGTYTIIGNEVPNFSSSNIINVVDTLNVAITGNNTKFISGHNKVSGVITPMSSSYGANLDYYSISSSGVATQTKSYSSSNISFTIDNVTSSQIKVNAVDKRTLSKEATKDITIIPYSKPTLIDNVITRQDGVGDHIYLNLSGKYTNWSGLSKTNGIQTFKYRTKAQGTSTWGSWKTITGFVNSSGTWSINKLLDDTFVNTQRYDMQVQVTDLLETVTFSGLLVSTANALMWKDLQNKRVGINKKPNAPFDLDVAGAIAQNGRAVLDYTIVDEW